MLVSPRRTVLLAPKGGLYRPFEYLVICDPLHRRYVSTPPIPGYEYDTRATSRHQCLDVMDVEPFLDPASKEEDDLAFRVISIVLFRSKVVAMVFSSDTGKWETATTFTYDYAPFVRYYAHNCFYWTHWTWDDVLVLNPLEMEFSAINIPLSLHDHDMSDIAIVNSGESRLGLLAFGSGESCLELYSKSMSNNDVGTEDWQHDRTIPLPSCHFTMIGAPEGNLVLHGVERGWRRRPKYAGKDQERQYFIVDLKALLVERLCVFDPMGHHVYPYASFLPPFSLPSIYESCHIAVHLVINMFA
ncbi:hypothetical protein PR202_gb24257 [Eleusine coracana subsp. coracana]|uniref:F-box protein n=1 Tax=Eleusine coracana subsp. coracana TaxID=191504 RepID=A0AAV5FMJ0_ELECO|nr:hypothetical protein PR202_gb24257 [Eleusine coracana subsp. coracana]